jgi:hypothetical protein
MIHSHNSCTAATKQRLETTPFLCLNYAQLGVILFEKIVGFVTGPGIVMTRRLGSLSPSSAVYSRSTVQRLYGHARAKRLVEKGRRADAHTRARIPAATREPLKLG